MSEEKKSADTRQQEMDEFWDISSLVVQPKKRPAARQAFDTATSEIELSASTSRTDAKKQDDHHTARVHRHQVYADATYSISEKKLQEGSSAGHPPKERSDTPLPSLIPPATTYHPEHPLIEEVTLHPWRNRFPYYERFCQNAKELFAIGGEKCAPVPFFSYMPQYDQMNRAQLAWYLYWRDRVRAGEYLKTDYSYIFLLLFEIINLPDQIPPAQGLSLLCDLWTHYREEHPLLDRYLCEWICDYCLLYRLLPPMDQLGVSFGEIASECQLREFYVTRGEGNTADDIAVYLRCCSNYDYKKSRAYTSAQTAAAAFDRHIPAALQAVLKSLTENSSLFSQIKMQSTTLTRDTFVGALCSHRVKYKIEVRYRSFSRSHELRFFITDVVKYAENKLRAALGYKSRLSIYALPEQAKNVLNAYFAAAFPRAQREGIVETRPEYEKLYDLPDTPMSSAQAAQIEKASWATTQRLIEAFGEQTEDSAKQLPQEANICISENQNFALPQPKAKQPSSMPVSPFSDEQRAFLSLALKGNKTAMTDLCRQIDKMPEMLADAINEIAVDAFGDILLEDDGNGVFAIIEDYRDDVRAMLGE